MIKVYYAKNDREWDGDTFTKMLTPLPPAIQAYSCAYKNWRDRQARILDKWMLKKLLEDFGSGLTLADLYHTSLNKPYFDDDFEFSSAHSGDMVMCAGAIGGQPGIDVEIIRPIELEDYKDWLTGKEWDQILSAPYKQLEFFRIWTKKEAFLKSTGSGLDIELNSIDASANSILYTGKLYQLPAIDLGINYVAHLAISTPVAQSCIVTNQFILPQL